MSMKFHTGAWCTIDDLNNKGKNTGQFTHPPILMGLQGASCDIR